MNGIKKDQQNRFIHRLQMYNPINRRRMKLLNKEERVTPTQMSFEQHDDKLIVVLFYSFSICECAAALAQTVCIRAL